MQWSLVGVAVLAGGCLLRTPEPAPQLAHPKVPAAVADTESIGVTWIGHATVLVRIRDRWILTDPVLGKRIAKVMPRNVEAGLDPKELPKLDAVLISHAHFDHLDIPSLHQLPKVPILMPSGATKFLPDALPATGLATWQQWSHDGLTITAVPASHGDGRYLVDRWNHATHTGYVIQYQGLTVYFAGDTGYIAKDAAELRQRYTIDVALIPIGPAGRATWIERWRADVHATPEHALALFTATGAQWMVPIHFDTFFKPRHHERPFLDRAIASAHLERRVRVIGIGETTEFLY
ncbi:MAG: MBL fold metallo-hydrolase [Kofleriaceae bacterium]|nr:MBL fold metallo-hydrolase [Kofleriaceae bacterium]